MKKIETPHDLLIHELKDLHSAENQLLKALPKMEKGASSKELGRAFKTHAKQTEEHVKRLEKIGEKLGRSLRGQRCKGMAGLIEEAAEIMKEKAEPVMLDLALIGAAQKAEHYEIAGYGTVRALAELSGEDEIAKILQTTLDEESATDELLTKIALNLDVASALAEAQ